jgi:hypothetical protein
VGRPTLQCRGVRPPAPFRHLRSEPPTRHPLIRFGCSQGGEFTIPVTVTNQGAVLWPALGTVDGSFQVFVGNHWLSSEGKMIIFDDGRCALPHDVNPGQSFDI